MTKPKVFKRYIRMYVLFFKRRIILRVSNFIDDKSPVKKYSVTEHDIDKAGDALDKLFRMIESSIYYEQLETADKYLDVYFKMFPFTVILEKMVRRKIEKKMKTADFYDLDLYENYEKENLLSYVKTEEDLNDMEIQDLFNLIVKLESGDVPIGFINKMRKEQIRIAKKVMGEKMRKLNVNWK